MHRYLDLLEQCGATLRWAAAHHGPFTNEGIVAMEKGEADETEKRVHDLAVLMGVLKE